MRFELYKGEVVALHRIMRTSGARVVTVPTQIMDIWGHPDWVIFRIEGQFERIVLEPYHEPVETTPPG